MDSSGVAALLPSIGALLVILCLLLGAGFLSRRLRGTGLGTRLNQWRARHAPASQIQLVATRPLGGQNTLVIAEVEGIRFLIGISRSGISAIGRLDSHG